MARFRTVTSPHGAAYVGEEDNEHVSLKTAFGDGVVGGVVLSVLLSLFRSAGWTALNVPMIWGSLFTSRMDAGSWWLGFIVHLLISGLIGMAYGAVFRAYRRSGIGMGVGVSVIHWILGGIALAILAPIHPLLGETVPEPGLFALNYGSLSALIFLVLHLVYGATVGGLFRTAAVSEAKARGGRGEPLSAGI